jgi:hypothetical protein
MSTIPPSAVPGPEKLPEQEVVEEQPDPFGEQTDRDGKSISEPQRPADDPDPESAQ